MLHFRIADPSEIAHTRRQVTELARNLGLTATDVGSIALIVTELGTNILKHAMQGELIAQGVVRNHLNGVELLAFDKGPGMANVSACLRDGYSTAGSPGTGLGAIVRASTMSEIFSLPGKGTVVFARIMGRSPSRLQFKTDPDEMPSATETDTFATGVVSVAKTEQRVCGDGWAVSQHPYPYRLMVADGIGHGPEAAEAARQAVRIFHYHPTAVLKDLLGLMHAALRPTRGAVVAIAEIHRAEQEVRYCGVGNISATLMTSQGMRSLVSLNGVVGHQLPTLKEFSYSWNPEVLLVMHSDGLASRWSLAGYPGLLGRHPSVIAGILYRDFSRGGRDDVTVAAVKAENA